MQDKEMLRDLIVESREHLQNIEPDLLRLEQDGAAVPDELINRVFRAVHSIKGGFGFFGIARVVDLSHAMEAVMAAVRDRAAAVTPELVDALLGGMDKLRALLDDIDNVDAIAIEEELQRLKPFIGAKAPAKLSPKKDVPKEPERISVGDLCKKHPGLAADALAKARERGRFVYLVTLSIAEHISAGNRMLSELVDGWSKFGEVLSTIPHPSAFHDLQQDTAPSASLSAVYATVLESDLVADALSVPAEGIVPIDLESGASSTPPLPEYAAKQAEGGNGGSRQADADESLRVRVALLNELMNYAGELVLARNQVLQRLGQPLKEYAEVENAIESAFDRFRGALQRNARFGEMNEDVARLEKELRAALAFPVSSMHGLGGVVQNVNMVTTLLQEGIMQTRLQPISVVFSKFPRLIRDLARKLSKKIDLVQVGQEVELDKSIIESLSDPLTHLVRNAADHGIERPLQRAAAGKNETGQLVLSASQEGGKVIVEVIDDGAGVSPVLVREKAVEKGVISQERAQAISDAEALALIFAPGFSTASTVSDISGRGVGMDVVKSNIERLGGSVEIESEPGIGTRIAMKVPLTLAIIPSLIVRSEGRRFAVPQVALDEIVRIRAREVCQKIERVHNAEVLRLRGKLLPLVRLASVLGLNPTFVHPDTRERKDERRERWSDRRGDKGQEEAQEHRQERRNSTGERRQRIANAVKIAVLRAEKRLFGLVVDEVLDTEEIVVKSLPEFLKESVCYSGTTIMGDGSVAMILDPGGIASMAHLDFSHLDKEAVEERRKAELHDEGERRNILVFSLGTAERFAVNLSSVAHVEKYHVADIETIGEKEFLKRDGTAVPLFRLERYLPVQQHTATPETFFALLPRNAQRSCAILVVRVEDTVETALTAQPQPASTPGIAGTMIINGRMVVLLDMQSLLARLDTQPP